MPRTTMIHDFVLPIRSEHDLRDFVRCAFGVRIPNTRCCPQHTTPWRAFSDAYFARSRVAIWKASRGFGGKTFLLSVLAATEALTLRADVNVLGGSGEQSARVLEHSQSLWNYEDAPREYLTSDVMRETRLTWGNKIRALLASQTSVRGPHPQRLRMDEVDEMDLAILDAAMGQPMEADTGIPAQTVFSSTHQYANGTMTEVLKRAAEKHWPVYTWCIAGNSEVSTPTGTRKIRDLGPGDEVYAYQSGRIIRTKVRAAWSSGTRPTVVVSFTGGRLICTPEHRILTPAGWQYAGNLTRGTALLGMREEAVNARPSLPQQDRDLWSMSVSAPALLGASGQLSSLWWPQAATLPPLRRLLPQGDYGQESRTSRIPGCIQGTTGTESETGSDTTGANGRRTSLLSRLALSIRSSSLQVLRRLLPARLQPGNRGQRGVLAHATRADGAGPAETRGIGTSGDCAPGPLGHGTPSVVEVPVRSVENGPLLEVWDLSVEEGESFVAEGVIVHNCYHETLQPHGWLSTTDLDGKRSEVTTAMWDVEYELQEPSPEGRAIVPEAIDVLFDHSLGEFEGYLGEEIELEPPIPGALYATGADWAKKQHHTVIWTLRCDCVPARTVAYLKTGRLPWPVMIGNLHSRVQRYPGAAWHDGTGLGDVVNDYLYIPAEPFLMVGRARSEMLAACISAIEHHSIRAPFIRSAESALRYASQDDVFGSGHCPDDLVALALAWHGSRTGGPLLLWGNR